MTPEIAYGYLFRFIIAFMIVYIAAGIYRSVRGPEVCDRIVGVNMTGSAVIVCILTLTALLDEGYLADIAVIYALVNFASTVILCRVYYRRNGGGKNAG